MKSRSFPVPAVLLVGCLASTLAAQPPGKTDEEPSRLNEAIEKSVDWYDVLPEEGAAAAQGDAGHALAERDSRPGG